MNVHKNARLTPIDRERMVMMVLRGQTLKAVDEAVGVCPRTVRKWIVRFAQQGAAGLLDRRSRPRRLYRPTPPAVVEQIEAHEDQPGGIKPALVLLSLRPPPRATSGRSCSLA